MRLTSVITAEIKKWVIEDAICQKLKADIRALVKERHGCWKHSYAAHKKLMFGFGVAVRGIKEYTTSPKERKTQVKLLARDRARQLYQLHKMLRKENNRIECQIFRLNAKLGQRRAWLKMKYAREFVQTAVRERARMQKRNNTIPPTTPLPQPPKP